MKKIVFFLTAIFLMISLTACGGTGGNGGNVLKVGATPVPHAEILNDVVKPELAKQGITLEVVTFQDYQLPNTQLAEKQLDANYFQHLPFLETTNKEKGYTLVPVAGVHIEPVGVYSNKEKKYTSIDQVPDGATIAVTNDPSNLGRFLALLEKNGLIKLKEGVGTNGTLQDIAENPKNYKFLSMDPPLLPRAIEDPKVDIAVINTNFALQAGLNPLKDALILEDKDSPYVNILVTRTDNKDDPKIKKLAEVLTSDAIKNYIEEKYKGAIVPAQKLF
ncbi:MAG: MetQ/NlpA family ABC transporter substrate-binding protein [Thermicanus sp.]|nr:MetQ/NlpA family ABC transporter substrate-binding protein [Thermicanus sp.]